MNTFTTQVAMVLQDGRNKVFRTVTSTEAFLVLRNYLQDFEEDPDRIETILSYNIKACHPLSYVEDAPYRNLSSEQFWNLPADFRIIYYPEEKYLWWSNQYT